MHSGYFLSFMGKLTAAWRVALIFALCLWMAFYGAAAQARSPLVLDASQQPIALGDAGEYWIDNGLQQGPDQVDGSVTLTWLATPERGIYPLKPGHTLWIRFTAPSTQDAERWVLEIPYPALDRASLYTKDRAGKFTEQRAGDLTAVRCLLARYGVELHWQNGCTDLQSQRTSIPAPADAVK